MNKLANVYLLMGDYQKVINLSERALALDTTFFSAYRHLADAYYALGDVDQLSDVSRKIQALRHVPGDIPPDIAMKLHIARGELDQARAALSQRAQQANEEKDGTWIFPTYVRLPEQAPDSKPWQEFWRLPGVAELAELRRKHGFRPTAISFGDGANQ